MDVCEDGLEKGESRVVVAVENGDESRRWGEAHARPNTRDLRS